MRWYSKFNNQNILLIRINDYKGMDYDTFNKMKTMEINIFTKAFIFTEVVISKKKLKSMIIKTKN